MSDRFFVETPIDSDRAELIGPEAHHLAHVMRAEAGAVVILFDGSGVEFSARVTKVGRSRVELAVMERREIDRELPFPLVLGVALPKGDRQKWLMEKATELGVTRIVPLATKRGVAQPADQALDRLRRSVIEASKQCGRNRLLEISPPQCLEDYLSATAETCVRWLAHPGGRELTPEDEVPSAGVHLAIGPEGGFTDEEAASALARGWQMVSLGPRILRVETAAIALCARWI